MFEEVSTGGLSMAQQADAWFQKYMDSQDRIVELTATLNGVYEERANLVALIAALYRSGWNYSDETMWPIVYIDLPTGQASWHINPDDWWIFACVPRRQDAEWDGHTTEQKYQRIRNLIESIEKGEAPRVPGQERS